VSLVATLGLLAACRSGGSPITIGVAGNFQDPSSAPMQHAAQLAALEINQAGGVRGRSIEILLRDDHDNPDSAIMVATDLYRAGVVAVVGHGFSGPTLAAAAVYNGGHDPVVQISPSASAPEVTGAGPYTFRLCPTDLAHGAALARWVFQDLGMSNGAILYLNNAYGRGFRTTFAEEFGSLGGEVEVTFPFLGDPPEVGPLLDRIASPEIEFLVVAGYLSDAEEILRLARQRGLNMPVLGGDGLEGIERSGPLAEGTYVTAAYLPTIDTPRNRTFVDAYQAMFPDEPAPNISAAGTYDAIYLVRDIVARVGTDRTKIRDALAVLGTAEAPFEGVLGTVALDANGDVINPAVHVSIIRDGVVAPPGGRTR
jgi:branched-chain amino acid transport system substrate-binding protein